MAYDLGEQNNFSSHLAEPREQSSLTWKVFSGFRDGTRSSDNRALSHADSSIQHINKCFSLTSVSFVPTQISTDIARHHVTFLEMPGSLHQSSHEASRPRKRLIVCCDGTWQASDKTYGITPSNIAKLSRMIDREDRDPEDDRVIPQVVYYQSGVGTGTAGPLAVGYEG